MLCALSMQLSSCPVFALPVFKERTVRSSFSLDCCHAGRWVCSGDFLASKLSISSMQAIVGLGLKTSMPIVITSLHGHYFWSSSFVLPLQSSSQIVLHIWGSSIGWL